VAASQKVVQITSSALASKIGVVSSRNQADSFRCASVEIARSVRSLLNFVRSQAVLVVNDCVVRRLDGALKSCMGLKVKVKVKAGRERLATAGPETAKID